jgi:hypothetical protein
MTADRIQLVGRSEFAIAMLTGFVEGSAQSGPVVPSCLANTQTPMSTFQVPESPQAPGAACET